MQKYLSKISFIFHASEMTEMFFLNLVDMFYDIKNHHNISDFVLLGIANEVFPPLRIA